MTALHIASCKGRSDIVRYMCLKGKMNIDAQDVVSFGLHGAKVQMLIVMGKVEGHSIVGQREPAGINACSVYQNM